MKKTLTALIALALVAASASAPAAPIYTVDDLLGSTNPKDSAKATELAALQGFITDSFAPDPTTAFARTEFNNSASYSFTLDGAGNYFLDLGAAAPADLPAYFALKFGTGSTKVANSTYYFENIGELNKLVFSNDLVSYLTGGDCTDKTKTVKVGSGKDKTEIEVPDDSSCNIDRLSHISFFGVADDGKFGGGNPPPTGDVPEPASLALMGLGMAGVMAARRRKVAAK